ncbi:hypothetical protein C8T65DRAFT_667283 [Cerioporus squamosus]|nr:hypothetical protein C8T65DRAFT_667283 [Cerioporus squamosus]
MFSALLSVASLAILAVATPAPAPDASCSTGPIQCCQSTAKASDPAAAGILSSIGVVVQDIDALVGLTCSPVTVIGVGSGGTWYVALLRPHEEDGSLTC